MVTLTQLIETGLVLVPIPYGKKAPINSGWNLKENCVFEKSLISKVEGSNVGLAHAYCSPSPTCALDIDHYPSAKIWFAMHGFDLDELINKDGNIGIYSGKKYSLKLIFRLPKSIGLIETKKIIGPNGNCAIEFRCATKDDKTVQDVLPPSLHPDGYKYQWVGNGDPLNILEIPSELLSLWLSLISNSNRVLLQKLNPTYLPSKIEESPRKIANIREALSHISADCDRELWRNIVWAILSTGWKCAEEIARDWSMSAPNKYDEDEFWILVNSYIPNHSSPITIGTIYYHARQGGWNG